MTAAFFTEPFHAFAFYVALNGLVMLVLSVLVVRARRQTQTSIGDGAKPEMAGPLRAHSNNTEYVPMALLLMWAMLPIGGSAWMIHAVGIPLTIGRILHGVGMSRSIGPTPLRLIGMALTWLAFIIGIIGCLWIAFVPDMIGSAS